MRVTVTGAAGFIGAHLCRALVPHAEVVGLDDLSTGSREHLAGTGVRLIEASLADRDAVTEAVAGADAVVHLAARASVPASVADPAGAWQTNAEGTMTVLEAVRGAGGGSASASQAGPHLVYASSSAVYGDPPSQPVHEELPVAAGSPYAAGKLAGEQAALAHQAVFGLPVLALRFFNVYGPLQPADHAYAAAVPAFIARALAGQTLAIHGDGLQTRDFVDVGTVAAILTDAVRRRVTHPSPVNLASGAPRTLLEVVDALERLLGHPVARQHTDPRAGDVRHSTADITRLRALFPAVAAQDFDAGLAATVAWFRNRIATNV